MKKILIALIIATFIPAIVSASEPWFRQGEFQRQESAFQPSRGMKGPAENKFKEKNKTVPGSALTAFNSTCIGLNAKKTCLYGACFIYLEMEQRKTKIHPHRLFLDRRRFFYEEVFSDNDKIEGVAINDKYLYCKMSGLIV